MWSSIKLDSLFYDFIVIYNDFFKNSSEINKKMQQNRTANHLGVLNVWFLFAKVRGLEIWFCCSGGRCDPPLIHWGVYRLFPSGNQTPLTCMATCASCIM